MIAIYTNPNWFVNKLECPTKTIAMPELQPGMMLVYEKPNEKQFHVGIVVCVLINNVNNSSTTMISFDILTPSGMIQAERLSEVNVAVLH